MIAQAPGAVTVRFGTFTTPGILDFEGQGWGPSDRAQVSGELITLTYCYPDLPGLGADSLLVIGEASYAVAAGPYRKADGLEAIARLEAQ